MAEKPMPPPQEPRGLDLSDLDRATPEEIAAFREYYTRMQGRPHEGWQFFLENNPSAMKRWRLYADYVAIPFNQWLILTATDFANAAWYAQLGFAAGIRYVVHIQQTSGRFSREQVCEGLGISLYYGGPPGGEAIAAALRDYEWREPAEPIDLSGWNASRQLISSGLDFTSTRLLPDELEMLESWYLRAIGEVPGYVRFFAKHRPEALKAHRNRYENLVKTLPVQLLPLAAIKIAMYRSQPAELRENVLLARYLGISKADTLLTAMSGLLYGNVGAASMLEAVAGDVLDEEWPQAPRPAG